MARGHRITAASASATTPYSRLPDAISDRSTSSYGSFGSTAAAVPADRPAVPYVLPPSGTAGSKGGRPLITVDQHLQRLEQFAKAEPNNLHVLRGLIIAYGVLAVAYEAAENKEVAGEYYYLRGRAAERTGSYDVAAIAYQKAVALGCIKPELQFALGWFYDHDFGRQEDMGADDLLVVSPGGILKAYPAAAWSMRAAKLKHSEAQYIVGMLYSGMSWWEKLIFLAYRKCWEDAAEQGHELAGIRLLLHGRELRSIPFPPTAALLATAQPALWPSPCDAPKLNKDAVKAYRSGLKSLDGEHPKHEDQKSINNRLDTAARSFQEAITLGYPGGAPEYRLAMVYAQKKPSDDKKFDNYLRQSANKQHPLGLYKLARVYENRAGNASRHDEYITHQRAAANFYFQAAKAGIPYAQVMAGDYHYLGGDVVKQDRNTASLLWHDAAEESASAQVRIGCYISHERRIKIEWLRKALERLNDLTRNECYQASDELEKAEAELARGAVSPRHPTTRFGMGVLSTSTTTTTTASTHAAGAAAAVVAPVTAQPPAGLTHQ